MLTMLTAKRMFHSRFFMRILKSVEIADSNLLIYSLLCFSLILHGKTKHYLLDNLLDLAVPVKDGHTALTMN